MDYLKFPIDVMVLVCYDCLKSCYLMSGGPNLIDLIRMSIFDVMKFHYLLGDFLCSRDLYVLAAFDCLKNYTMYVYHRNTMETLTKALVSMVIDL